MKYKIELKWGLIMFGAALGWMVLERVAGLHGEQIEKHAFYTNFFAVVIIALYVFALMDKRRHFHSGLMSWKQGFVTGLIITGIVVVLSPLSQLIIHMVISPDFFPNIIEYAVSEEMMDRAQAESYFSLGNYILQSATGGLFLGILTSAIVAIFTKRKQPEVIEGE